MATDTESVGASIVFGVIAGLVSACLLGGGAAFVVEKRLEKQYRAGWNLVPVVVAAVDVPADTVVTFDMISQRSLPEQFVTDSSVKPDSASYIVNESIHRAAQAGDPLLWQSFVDRPCLDALERSAKSAEPTPGFTALQRKLRAEVGTEHKVFMPAK
jgi:Flp pilus assembly protein CpaB